MFRVGKSMAIATLGIDLAKKLLPCMGWMPRVVPCEPVLNFVCEA